jgi:hypothetical protein
MKMTIPTQPKMMGSASRWITRAINGRSVWA